MSYAEVKIPLGYFPYPVFNSVKPVSVAVKKNKHTNWAENTGTPAQTAAT